MVGSSPLARGARRRPGPPGLAHRLIPAGAGRTAAVRPAWVAARAHPRWRGAHDAALSACGPSEGSSPLARGAPRRPRRRHPTSPAHPRWRGAHDPLPRVAEVGEGSSPLARGAPASAATCTPPTGLIPAGAGRTTVRRRRRQWPTAHPRWRGAHVAVMVIFICVGGSSPLARGARGRREHEVEQGGLIPAGAGRTPSATASAACTWAHPRWRGAHPSCSDWRARSRGSSPLARGARFLSAPHADAVGLIPAGAGRT